MLLAAVFLLAILALLFPFLICLLLFALVLYFLPGLCDLLCISEGRFFANTHITVVELMKSLGVKNEQENRY